ncbi:MAG TPA: hypothetical protein DGL25_01560 [Dehalococcoidia bacterium]|nr:hypothetical protein [Dehalococcoidia bacterium]|tara:strand:+ start:3619 stop:4038 length:420 start_codon:yes stop_codon:yes gene_type:complete
MVPVLTLRQKHLDEMVEHALEDAPNECCGLIGARDGKVTKLHRAVNAEASPYRFSIDFREQRRIEEAMDQAGDSLAGFYHSHTGSPARPSPTDIRMMATFFGPPYVHVVVSIANRSQPDVRAFYIEGESSTEQEYTLEL